MYTKVLISLWDAVVLHLQMVEELPGVAIVALHGIPSNYGDPPREEVYRFSFTLPSQV